MICQLLLPTFPKGQDPAGLLGQRCRRGIMFPSRCGREKAAATHSVHDPPSTSSPHASRALQPRSRLPGPHPVDGTGWRSNRRPGSQAGWPMGGAGGRGVRAGRARRLKKRRRQDSARQKWPGCVGCRLRGSVRPWGTLRKCWRGPGILGGRRSASGRASGRAMCLAPRWEGQERGGWTFLQPGWAPIAGSYPQPPQDRRPRRTFSVLGTPSAFL